MKLIYLLKYYVIPLLIGGILGLTFPLFFIYLDLTELKMEFTNANLFWIIKSQNVIYFSVWMFPFLFMTLFLFLSQILTKSKMLRENSETIGQMAHAAGMAEIASEVLHNIGNILTVFYVNIEGIQRVLKRSKYQDIVKAKEIFEKERDSIQEMLKEKPQFYKLYDLLFSFGLMIEEEYTEIEKFNNKTKDKMKTVRDILAAQQNYARSDSYHEETTPKELITKTLDVFSYKMEKMGIHLKTSIENNSPFVTETNKVVNILTNIVKNAIEAVVNFDGPKNIDINVYREHDFQIFSVKDTGMGISKEALEKLFTHGFTTKSAGKGFGLHSCYNLANGMGGKIEVVSEGEGKGATFMLKVPLKK